MKILVCISAVPDTTAKINFTNEGRSLDKNGIQFVINPYDEFVLTRAIWFQEKQSASVTVACVGDSSTEAVIRKALAIGANDAIRIDTEPSSSYFTAYQLAKIIKENGYDLVLAGKESIDYNGAAVPAMAATLSNYTFINSCVGLNIDGNTAEVVTEIDGGKETIKTNLPLVIAGQKGIVEEKDLRIPNMRGIMQARTKPLQVIKAEPIEEKLIPSHFEKPEEKKAITLIDANNLDALVSILADDLKAI